MWRRAGDKHDKSYRITDPRLLFQLIDPDIPVRVGRHRVFGKITDFENEQWANVQITLYHFGPPVSEFQLNREWPWPEVHTAWATGRPLDWY